MFEAADEVSEFGLGINMLPHAVRELTELRLADSLAAVAIPTGELVMFSTQGQQIWREPPQPRRRLPPAAVQDERLARLTDQERRILDLIAQGYTNRQIANEIFLAEKTVKHYVSNLLAKLGMERRTEAAAFAARLAAEKAHRPPQW